jgi:hypothetical protein
MEGESPKVALRVIRGVAPFWLLLADIVAKVFLHC